MAETVVGLMENAAEAQQVVEELMAAGIDRGKIGMMASGAEGGLPNEAPPDDSVVGEGVLKGAGTGAVFGGLTGLLAGLAGLAIPGVGPVIAAGPIATALAGGGIGAVAGGAISALTHAGVPEEEMQFYTEGLRRGGVLVTVYAEDADMAERSAEIMRRHYAADPNERALPGDRAMPDEPATMSDREETGASVNFMAANETSFDPTGMPGSDEFDRAGRLAALDAQSGERQDEAGAEASLQHGQAGAKLADELGTPQQRSTASSGTGANDESLRQPASSGAPADYGASRKPPKAQHAKASAVRAAALFIGSERRRGGALRYTGIERRATT